MPYEITVEDNGARVVTRYFGRLTTAELMESYAKRLTDTEKIKKYNVLVSDFTEVTASDIGDLDIVALAQMYKQAASYNPKVTAVAIVPQDFLFGMGRMWDAYVNEIPWKQSIVRTKEEAMAFVDTLSA
jgi:hypothetical protein